MPAVGALLAVFGGARWRVAAPISAAAALGVSLALWSQAGQLFTSIRWITASGLDIRYALGLSGLSLLLIGLTLLLTVIAGIAGWSLGPGFLAWINVLGASATGLFLARDLVLFYLFWEAMLVPTYFLLVGWGGGGRRAAAWKFLVYNVGGSLFLLAGIAALVAFGVVMPGERVSTVALGSGATLIGLALFVGFAVKTPLWPVHGWVADTYAELPAPAAALVAGVQSKAGLYGMLAILLPVLPQAATALAPLMIAVGVVSIFYGAFAALASHDPRRLLARSSVSHLGLIMVAIVTLRSIALTGAVVQMITHGLVTAGLFLVVGILEQRLRGAVRLQGFRGLASQAPGLGGALMLLGMAALGLPGLGGFPGELLMVVGIYRRSILLAVLAVIGLVLSAAYMLRLIQLLLHGPSDGTDPVRDLGRMDRVVLVPLAGLLLLIGLWPKPLPAETAASVRQALSTRHVTAQVVRSGDVRSRSGAGQGLGSALQLDVQEATK